MANHNHKIPFEFNFEIGELEIDLDYEITPAYYGTKVDDINDFNSSEFKYFQINEAIFINDNDEKTKFTKEQIEDNYDKIKTYFIENIDTYLDK